MEKRSFVTCLSDLNQSVLAYQAVMGNLDTLPEQERADLVQALSMARAWVAIEQPDGEYVVGYAKYVAYGDQTPTTYMTFRKSSDHTRLDGTEADRRISNMGGKVFPLHSTWTDHVGEDDNLHPAAKAVREFVKSHGKCVNKLAEVRVFSRDEVDPYDPVKMIHRMIEGAQLSTDQREELRALI